MRKLLSILTVAIVLSFYSCASNELKNSDNPEIVYNEAVRLLEDNSYLEASDFFAELRRRFPQSRFSILAELRSADMDFNQSNFIEAAAGYGVFVDLYPKHKEAPYALYKKTLSFFNAAPDLIARDQSSAQFAIKSANLFLVRYAGSPHKKDVADILIKSRLKLAKKEAYIARFYTKREAYEASVRRWESLIKNYADIQSTKDGKKLILEANKSLKRLRNKIQKGKAS